jgi:hypothetical protein
VARIPFKFDDGFTPSSSPKDGESPVGPVTDFDVFTAYIRVSRKGVALVTSVTAATVYSLISLILSLFQGSSVKIW